MSDLSLQWQSSLADLCTRYCTKPSCDPLSIPHAHANTRQIHEWLLQNQEVLARIKTLNLSELNIFSLFEQFYLFDALLSFDVSQNSLAFLPDTITRLENLFDLDASENQLKLLPYTIGDLKNLTTLNLSKNALQVLPQSFCNLTDLTALYLSHNLLVDLPKGFCQLINLQEVDLSHNKIKQFNDNIYQMQSLEFLNLSHNKLTSAALSKELFSLKNLEFLDLSNNNIKSLPDALFEDCKKENMTLFLVNNPLDQACIEKLQKKFSKWIIL